MWLARRRGRNVAGSGNGVQRSDPARWFRCLVAPACVLAATLGAAACSGTHEPDAAGRMTMRSAVTYRFLLRNTPFFTALSTEQLQWVIRHSHEWAADAGAVIAKCEDSRAPDAPYWILLDGGWQVETGGRTFARGHADPGKWFSGSEGQGQSCQLVTNQFSYVMRIDHADMQHMLGRGFQLGSHLDSGARYYRSIFGNE
ncbi:hypothetical protein Bxe_A2695 [Paraburkholderia xenovorans LB400]|uniref:Uncharacterized protein n=1 Tax=Paraburkholderia xenovorans (strain LB400) TaxID=266265 RepID=Q140H3_PARXL|nr:hypothetical protein Bxe_A2695 [Paraburkholderia xenovorans LB400]